MATRALTPVAQRSSRASASVEKARADWRQVLLRQDAGAIWNQPSMLVPAVAPEHSAEWDQLTQELSLNLLATDRITRYLENYYFDSEIRADLLEALSE